MPYEKDKLNSEKNGRLDQEGPVGVKSELTQSQTEPGPTAGPELDQSRTSRQEAAKKIEELFHHTENRLNQIDGQLEQLPKMVQNTVIQVLQKFQEEQTKAGAGPTEEFSKMGKEEKMMMLAEFGKSLSEVISAWKGGSGPEAAGPDFKNIMADWGMKMFTFHLDNMAQSVYQIKLPPPPGVAERSLGPKAQPNFQNPIRPGVHKFE